ncbi:unnamed protein product [Urochloa humidicola]
MDSSENRDSQPKKPRKPFSIPTRSAGGVPAVASPSSLSATPVATAGVPGAAAPSATPVATAGGPGAAAPSATPVATASSPGTAAPSTGGGTSGQPDPSVFWAGMSLDGSSLRSFECRMSCGYGGAAGCEVDVSVHMELATPSVPE